jgi:type VI secretion system secreted protein Hcp
MALLAYLKLKGQQQGDIKGSVIQKGREGKIAVIAAEHELLSPRDAATGLPTGKRRHFPYTITKELDAASPRLYAMLAGNEAVTEWELQFWTPQIKAGTGVGTETQHYTVRLTDARLVDIRFHMLNIRNPDLVK